jgi:hypothetical protein
VNWLKHTLWYSEGNRLDYKPVNLQPLTVDTFRPKHVLSKRSQHDTHPEIQDLPLRSGQGRQALHADLTVELKVTDKMLLDALQAQVRRRRFAGAAAPAAKACAVPTP